MSAAITDLVFNIGVFMAVSKAVDFFDLEKEENTNIIRFAYAASQIIIFAIYFVVYNKIQRKDDRTILEYEEPAPPLSGEEPVLKRLTYSEYDNSELIKAGRSQLLNIAIIFVMHFKFGYIRPLLIQSVLGLRTIYKSTLFKIYILNEKAVGDLVRPWASTPFAAKPNPLSSKEAERKERKDRKKKTIHAD